jgi:hypothetical protein
MVARQRYRATIKPNGIIRIGLSGVAHLVGRCETPIAKLPRLVIGVQDRNYEVEVVHGNPDPQVVQRNDVGEYRYQVIKLKFKYGMQLPFVSYNGKRVFWHVGWQPSGFFGLKFNLHSERGSTFSANMEA